MSSKKAIGIDLGTTNSVAAIQNLDGLEVLHAPNQDSLIPSVVSHDGKRLLVGRDAVNNAMSAPKNTIFSIKRLMGRTYDDKNVSKAESTYSFEIAKASQASGGLEDAGVRVLFNGIERTPTEISSMILQQIITEARQATHDPDLNHVVITVPAHFAEPQRAATYEAGQMANLIVKQLLDEPTAAAISFGMNYSEDDHFLLVFDMGGGTLDVSILSIFGQNQYYVEHISGDMWLGGDDLDEVLIQMGVRWAWDTFQEDISKDLTYRVLAKREAQRLKEWLSTHTQGQFRIPAVIPISGGAPAGIDMRITRAEFEAEIQPIVDRAMAVVKGAMQTKQLTPDHLSLVLMVGGSSYVPLVQKELKQYFGEDKVKLHDEPMLAVALGAAIMADQLEGLICPNYQCNPSQPGHGLLNEYGAEKCARCGRSLSGAESQMKDIVVDRIIPRALGIGVIGPDSKPDYFAEIISANSPYPISNSRRFQTSGHKITIPVYEGHKPQASDNEYLGLVEYELPSDTPLKMAVDIHFIYDVNRRLLVKVEVPGRSDLDHESPPIRRRQAKDDTQSTQWELQLRSILSRAEQILKNYGQYIRNEQQRTGLQELMNQSLQAIERHDETAAKNLALSLHSALVELGTPFYLFVAENLSYGASPDDARMIGELSASLSRANQEGGQALEDRYSERLCQVLSSVVEKRRGTTGGTNKNEGLLHLLHSMQDQVQSKT